MGFQQSLSVILSLVNIYMRYLLDLRRIQDIPLHVQKNTPITPQMNDHSHTPRTWVYIVQKQ